MLNSSDSDSENESLDEIDSIGTPNVELETALQNVVEWINSFVLHTSFVPRKEIPSFKEPLIQFNAGFDEDCEIIDVFLKLFPRSLLMWIASCTNERLLILAEESGKCIEPTDYHEIMIVIGCYIIMSYNRVPAMKMYFSGNNTLKNDAIKNAIPRERFLLLSSKIYFNHPVKPNNCGKTYYMEEIVNCLKYTFQKSRTDSTYQSIDETMCKCKSRTSLKQYMKQKPIRVGVKMWSRCDACSGYIYDFDIYEGKETTIQDGTLGERVVKKLCSSIRDEDVAIIVDRFFMSVNLLKTLPHALVDVHVESKECP